MERLRVAGYEKNPLVEGCFRHHTRDIDFCPAVDDFLIQCANKEDIDHLCAAVRQHHKFEVDEEAEQFVGIDLRWDCDKRTVRLSMD